MVIEDGLYSSVTNADAPSESLPNVSSFQKVDYEDENSNDMTEFYFESGL